VILPGHVAAAVLASRRFGLDLRIAIVAGLAPDLVDKFAFYILHATRWTRVPAHSLTALAVSALVVALIGRWRRSDWRWGASWLAGYGAHLLCDMMPGEGTLPWLWPFRSYSDYVSPGLPWFLGGGPVPWLTLIAEAVLVLVALVSEIRRRRRLHAR